VSRRLEAGFVPLVDAAPLIAAAERGFAAEEGILLEPVRQASWASLRDHLNLGHVDCAQALAPLPIAAALGIGQVRADLAVPFVLSRGGNAITLSTALADEVRGAGGGESPAGAGAWGRALAVLLGQRREPVTLAMVYPFSGHNFELRYWLAAAGIHPDRDLRLVGIPPPLMVESLRAGQVDGFCVGEPWNSLAAASGVGEIVATKSEIFPRGIEKVLALPSRLLADEPATAALIRSVAAAAAWCDRSENHVALAEILARPGYLGVDPEIILRALDGRLQHAGTEADNEPDDEFLVFSRFDANRPRVEEALFLYAQMLRWGQVAPGDAAAKAAGAVYRPDVYARVIGPEEPVGPRPIAACDGIAFDAESVEAYLERFDIATPYGAVVGEL